MWVLNKKSAANRVIVAGLATGLDNGLSGCRRHRKPPEHDAQIPAAASPPREASCPSHRRLGMQAVWTTGELGACRPAASPRDGMPPGPSSVLKIPPVDSKLTDCRSHRPNFQISAAPVWDNRRTLGVGIEPLAVRTSAPARQFPAPEHGQFSCYLSVIHGAVTTVSSHTGSLASGIRAF